jgi:uncharacterized protein involved in exopolysaccharide biosynthesis
MLELKTPHDFMSAFKRRKWMLGVPLAIGLLFSTGTALLWPPLYRSIATILIEEPEVPRELVRSTVTSYADQRVQVISQRIMNTRSLISVIEKYGLYKEKRKHDPIGIVAQEMRESIFLNLVSANVIDPRSGRPGQATIAFTLAFDHKSPTNAQKVLNELVTLFLAENLRTRRQAAADTTAFLRSEAEKYSQLVDQYETRLAQFKREYAGNLPGQVPVMNQLKDRNEREILEVRGRLQALKERRIYLGAELAQLNPYVDPRTPSAEPTDPREMLKLLRTQYVTLSSKYGPSHPDVRKLEREIEALEKDVGPEGRRAAVEAERDALVAQLGDLRAKYSDKHPDVTRIRRQLDNVVAKLETMPANNDGVNSLRSSNPAYVRLQAELQAVDTEFRSLMDQQTQLQERQRRFEQELLAMPEIEREYRLLNRDYERTLTSYNVAKEKLTTAELGESLEAESRAEQFALVEPPVLPSSPIKPNRLAIFVLGVVLSLGVGGGLGALAEVMDSSVYGPLQLASVVGAPPLVVVPRISTAADIRRKWWIRVLALLAFIVVFAGAMSAVHHFIMPLDVMLTVAERNLEGFISSIRGD